MNKLRNMVGAAALLAYVLPSSGCSPHSTEGTEMGVRYCKFLCGENKIEVVQPAQINFFTGIRNDWYVLRIDMQNFYMTADLKTGDRKEKDDLEFKTNEGNTIGLDVVLTWKLDPKQMDHIVKEVGTSMDDIKEKYIRPIARSVVRDYFNRLESQEFYEGQRRFEAARDATEELKKRLAPYGIIVDQVNPQDYVFEDKDFQTAINEAKNAGQDKDRYERQKKAEEEKWLKQLEIQRGLSNQKIGAAEGYKSKTVLYSDAYFGKKQQEAQAITAEKKAAAEAVVKLRQAMASEGGNTSIMMTYVKHFNPTKIVVLPCDSGEKGTTIQRLDLNALMAAEMGK